VREIFTLAEHPIRKKKHRRRKGCPGGEEEKPIKRVAGSIESKSRPGKKHHSLHWSLLENKEQEFGKLKRGGGESKEGDI